MNKQSLNSSPSISTLHFICSREVQLLAAHVNGIFGCELQKEKLVMAKALQVIVICKERETKTVWRPVSE